MIDIEMIIDRIEDFSRQGMVTGKERPGLGPMSNYVFRRVIPKALC